MSKQKRDLPEINFIAASLRTTTGGGGEHHDLVEVTIASENNLFHEHKFTDRSLVPI